jgi:hypothetical protein
MNHAVLTKLSAIRQQILAEALDPDSYAKHLIEADASFLDKVAKELKKAFRSMKVEVKRGNSVAWLEASGEDSSDLSYDFTLALNPKTSFDVELNFSGDHAYKGRMQRDVAFKTGELTPMRAALVALEQIR